MAKNDTILSRIAQHITNSPVNLRKAILLEKEIPLQAAVFEILSPHHQQIILSELNNGEAVTLLDALDLRKAHVVLAQMKNEDRREKLITQLKSELKDKAEHFLQFHNQASLKIINFNYLLLSSDTTIEDSAEAMEQHYKETKRFPEILVHTHGIFIGEAPYVSLVRTANRTKLEKITVPLETIVYTADESEILELIHTATGSKLVIKDTDESVIGLIYMDEIRGMLNNQPAASLYEFAGVSESERPFDTVKTKIRNRYKWLIINLGTAFMAAFVISSYQETLDSLVILAMYLPIIAGMGGNAAAQTLAVMVRGIFLGEITLKNSLPALKNEVIAGAFHGAITGVIVACIALFWNQDPWLGLVLAIAMIINLAIAAMAGTLVPLIMKRLGKDPAASATIFITTITDVFGFLVFLWLATTLLL